MFFTLLYPKLINDINNICIEQKTETYDAS
jgi:hypothetical protein